MHDGELVPAKAGDHIGITNAAAQPTCNRFEEKIAYRMTVRIVHVLEAIKIETEHGHMVTPRFTRASICRNCS